MELTEKEKHIIYLLLEEEINIYKNKYYEYKKIEFILEKDILEKNTKIIQELCILRDKVAKENNSETGDKKE